MKQAARPTPEPTVEHAPPGGPPAGFRPRPKLFAGTLVLFAVWIAALIALRLYV